MRGGADLMTPGLARGPPFPSKAKKGAVVAIAAYERPSVPVVVGVCEIDVSALTEVRGVKGHAVRGMHWDSDEIWNWSSTGRAGGTAPPEKLEMREKENLELATAGVSALNVDESIATGETDNAEQQPQGPTKPVQEPENTAFEEVDRPKREWKQAGMNDGLPIRSDLLKFARNRRGIHQRISLRIARCQD